MELVSIKHVSDESKIALLNGLGYTVQKNFIFDSEGKKVVDKYVGVEVKLDNMMILPGSTIILDDNELSMALYIQEYGSGD